MANQGGRGGTTRPPKGTAFLGIILEGESKFNIKTGVFSLFLTKLSITDSYQK